METVLWALAALIFLPLGVRRTIRPRRVDEGPWRASLSQFADIYFLPPGYLVFGVVGVFMVLENIGLGLPELLQGIILMPLLIWLVVGFFGFMGVPMPPFMSPRWVRDGRRQLREQRRRRRQQRRQARAG